MLRNHALVAAQVVVALGVAWPVSGHTQGDSVFARVLMRRLDSMAAAPAVRGLTSARSGWELFVQAPIDDLPRLDDRMLMRFVEVFNRGLGQVDHATCARVWYALETPRWGEAYASVAAGVDSTTAEAWTDIIVQLVWAGLRDERAGSLATPEEREAVMRKAHTLIPAAELRKLGRIQQSGRLTDSDACFLMRSVYRSMLRLPPSEVAPVLRTMIGMPERPN